MPPRDTLLTENESDLTGELPVHCTHCGQAVTLFLDLRPALNGFNRPNPERHHPWACVWCGAENSLGFDGDIGGVVRGHTDAAIR
jgi:hypothetical protein